MGILPKNSKAQARGVRKKEQKEKQTMKKVGRMVPHRGHTIYEVHIPTLSFKPAAFEKEDYIMGPKMPNRKIIMKKDHAYIQALNEKNLKRKVLKFYGITL